MSLQTWGLLPVKWQLALYPCTVVRQSRCCHRRLDVWMDGWTDGWMDKWMDGWVDGRVQSSVYLPHAQPDNP